MNPKNFVELVDSDGTTFVLNLDLIRVAVFSGGGCDIWFDETQKLRLDGGAAIAVGQLLNDRSTSLNGEPIRLSTRLAIWG